MRKPRQDGATRPGRWRGRTCCNADADPDRSLGPSSPTVEKPYPFTGDFSLVPDTSTTVYCKGGWPYHNSDIGSEGRRTAPSTTAGREVEREPERPAAQRAQRASSPDRAAGANGGAHRLDRPEAALCGPTRKTDRQSDRRERHDRRCGLHLTFVRTTQERACSAISGSTAIEAAEVRGARASWQLGAPSHPTDAARCSR